MPDPAPGHAPPDTRLYAIGDIHGRLDLLEALLARIAADAATAKAARRQLIFVGDYIDRGPDSRAVVERVASGPPGTPEWRGFEWVALRGNHEAMLLSFLDDIEIGPVWLSEPNGGMATLASYCGGGRPAGDMLTLQRRFRAALPDAHRAFLARLPLSHRAGGYFFAHAGVRPGVPLDGQDAEDLMWIRGAFLDSRTDFGAVVVHGHTIVREPEVRPNRIGIDTGAFFSNRLTALVAEGEWRGFLAT